MAQPKLTSWLLISILFGSLGSLAVAVTELEVCLLMFENFDELKLNLTVRSDLGHRDIRTIHFGQLLFADNEIKLDRNSTEIKVATQALKKLIDHPPPMRSSTVYNASSGNVTAWAIGQCYNEEPLDGPIYRAPCRECLRILAENIWLRSTNRGAQWMTESCFIGYDFAPLDSQSVPNSRRENLRRSVLAVNMRTLLFSDDKLSLESDSLDLRAARRAMELVNNNPPSLSNVTTQKYTLNNVTAWATGACYEPTYEDFTYEEVCSACLNYLRLNFFSLTDHGGATWMVEDCYLRFALHDISSDKLPTEDDREEYRKKPLIVVDESKHEFKTRNHHLIKIAIRLFGTSYLSVLDQ